MQGERPRCSRVPFLNIDPAEIPDKWLPVSKHKSKVFDWTAFAGVYLPRKGYCEGGTWKQWRAPSAFPLECSSPNARIFATCGEHQGVPPILPPRDTEAACLSWEMPHSRSTSVLMRPPQSEHSQPQASLCCCLPSKQLLVVLSSHPRRHANLFCQMHSG